MTDRALAIAEAIQRIQGNTRSIGGVAVLKSGGTGLVVDSLSDPAVDPIKMSVRMRVTTEDIDRDGHVVLQSGGTWDNYRNNPIVLLDHAVDYRLPVALSETPEGAFTIEHCEDGIYATAYHKSSDLMSAQIFDMVNSGLIRACSLGFDPSEAFVRIIDGEEIVHFSKWDAMEWSYCGIPINPHALKRKSATSKNLGKFMEAWALQTEAAYRILNRGTLDGKPILPVLRKSLTGLVVPGPLVVTGFDPAEQEMSKKTLKPEEVKRLTAKQVLKAMTELDSYEDATKKAIVEQAQVKAEGEEESPAPGPQGEGEVETEVEADDNLPLGAKVASALHSQLMQIKANAEAALAPVENPEIRTKMDEELAKVDEIIASIEGVYSTTYPDLPGLAIEASTDEEQMKSFLASNLRSTTQLAGHAARLTSVAKSIAGKVSPNLVKALQSSASDLRRIGASAAAYKPKEKESSESGDQFKGVDTFLDRLEAKLKTIEEKIDKTPA